MKPGQILEIEGAQWRVQRTTFRTATLHFLGVGGDQVKRLREKAQLTTRAAAPLLGISQSELVKIENGSRPCTAAVLKKALSLKKLK